jgi:hypothetical protein
VVRRKRADVENDHVDEQIEQEDNEREKECWTVPLSRASWLRVDVTGVLGVRSTHVIQSPHWYFRWRCNNNRRNNTLSGRVISSAYSENDEKTRETISETGL